MVASTTRKDKALYDKATHAHTERAMHYQHVIGQQRGALQVRHPVPAGKGGVQPEGRCAADGDRSSAQHQHDIVGVPTPDGHRGWGGWCWRGRGGVCGWSRGHGEGATCRAGRADNCQVSACVAEGKVGEERGRVKDGRPTCRIPLAEECGERLGYASARDEVAAVVVFR